MPESVVAFLVFVGEYKEKLDNRETECRKRKIYHCLLLVRCSDRVLEEFIKLHRNSANVSFGSERSSGSHFVRLSLR